MDLNLFKILISFFQNIKRLSLVVFKVTKIICIFSFQNSSRAILASIILAGLFCSVIYIIAAPPVSTYSPGETLDPSCAPGDINCTVTPPANYNFSSNNFTGTGDFTTTGIVTAGTLKIGSVMTFPTTDGNAGQVLSTNGSGVLSWSDVGSSMVYPSAGIPISTGSAWGTSITDNSVNWNNAYGWGDHSVAGYLTSALASSTYVPYTGASGAVNLGANNLTIDTNTLFVDATNNMVGIGTVISQAKLSLVDQGSSAEMLHISRYVDNSGGGLLRWRKSRGTEASPTVVSTADTIGILAFQGYDGTAFRNAAAITGKIGDAPGSSDMPGFLTFETTSDGSTTLTERMRIDQNGNVGIAGGSWPGSKLSINGGLSVGSSTYYSLTAPTNGVIIEGNVGIGTSAPDKKLEINSATGDALRLTYNDADGSATNYADFAVTSGGNLTITPSGGTTTFNGGISTLGGGFNSVQISQSGTWGWIKNYQGVPIIAFNNSALGLFAGSYPDSNYVTIGKPVVIGNAVTHTTPTTGVLHGTGGSGTDIAGGNLVIAPGQSTGSAIPSSVIIQSTVAGVSGATAQTLSDTLTVTNGKVGIGTTSPSQVLQVEGNILSKNTASSTGSLYVFDTAHGISRTNSELYVMSNAAISMRPSGAEVSRFTNSGLIVNNNAGANFDFLVNKQTSGTVLFADVSSGNVGIGTASPSQKLEVNGQITAGNGVSYLGMKYDGSYGPTLNHTFNSLSFQYAGGAPYALLWNTGQLLLNGGGWRAPMAGIEINNVYANQPVAILKAATSQTANLQEWQNSAGTTFARITSDGKFSNPTGNSSESFGAGAVTGNHVQSLAVGSGANALGGDYATAIGGGSFSYSDSVALGTGATANGTSGVGSIAIGHGAVSAANQAVFAQPTSPITNVFFGRGVISSSPVAVTINGGGGSGTDIAGASLQFAGGKATGNATGGSILFQTSDTGSSGTILQSLTTKMSILASGNVGIGTTVPDKKLEINSATGDALRLTYNDSNGSATNYADFLMSSSGDLTVSASGGDISFDNENLLTTGTLGAGAITGTSYTIGANTISSFANLDSLADLSYSSGTPFVKMTAEGTFALDTNTYLTSLSGALLADGTVTGATSQAQVFTNGVIASTITGGSATTADLNLKTTSGVGEAGADMHFLVGNNGGTEAMTILNSGNVGIGTTSPANKLTVIGPTTADALADVMIGASATTQKGLVIQAKASQTANLFEAQTSTGAIGARITASGAFSNTGGVATVEIFGSGASAAGVLSVVIGSNATASSSTGDVVVIGANATTSAYNAVIIGRSASSSGTSNITAVGDLASCNGNNAVAFGASSLSSGGNSTALGYGTSAGYSGSIALGYRSTTTAINQFVAGYTSVPISDVYFGKGVTNATPTAWTLHGTGGSGTNIAGGNLVLAPGLSTGSATPSSVIIQSTVAGSSGATAQTLSDTLTVTNGKVGIGTTTPGAKLQIDKGDQNAGAGLILRNTYSANSDLQLGWSDYYRSAVLFGTGEGFYFDIGKKSDSGATKFLSISDIGPVTIGSNANARLSIARSVAPTTLSYENSYLAVGDMYTSSAGNYNIISLGKQGGYTYFPAYMGFLSAGGAWTTGHLVFGTRDSDADVVPTERVRITNTGNVGIGTTTPGAKLDVNGAIYQRPVAFAGFDNYLKTNAGNTSATTDLNAGILLYGLNTNVYGMDLGYVGSNYRTRIFAPGDQDISFAFSNTTPTSQSHFTEKMVIRSSGNVGIGTTNPGAKLDVYNTSNAVARFWNTGTSGTTAGAGLQAFQDDGVATASGDRLGFFTFSGAIDNSHSVSSGSAITSFATEGFSGSNQGSDLRFETTLTGGTSRNVRMIIDGNGNVGIGATSPSANLHVTGSTFPVILADRTDTLTNNVLSAIGVRHTTTADMVNGFGSGFTFQVQDNSAIAYALGAIYGVRNGADNTGDLAFYTYSTGTGTEKVRITTGGNVGIGTTSPGALLDIGSAGTTLGVIRLEGSTSGYVQIQPSVAAGSWTMTLPANDGDANQFLQTNGSGVLTWATGGGGVSFGTTTQIPYMNFGGTDFLYSAGLAYDGSVLTAPYANITTEASGYQVDGLRVITVQGSTGSENLFLGQSGNFTTTGTNNIFAGYQAGLASVADVDNIAIGYQSLKANTYARKNVAIGTQALYTQSYINATTPWDTANVAIGYQALYSNEPTSNSDGKFNTAVGYKTLTNNSTASNNAAFGYLAMGSGVVTGSDNTAVGSTVLYRNTTGTSNVGMGSSSLYSNTEGFSNIGIGYNSGYANVKSSNNIFIGTNAGSSNTYGAKNVAIGTETLYAQSYANGNTTWDTANVAIGYQALYSNQPTSNTNGYQNLAIGYQAGYSSTTGASNIFLGYKAGYRQTTNSNLLIIDNQDRTSAALEATNSLIYGSFNATVASQTLSFNAGSVSFGSDTAGGSTNVPGSIKLYSNGDNAYYTTFTSGTQTANATYILPTAMPDSNKVLQSTSGGVLSWVTAGGGVSFGTTTQIPYMNVAGNDFLYSAGLKFDGTTLTVTATGGAQQKLAYDGSNYATFTTSSTGNLTIATATGTTGGDIIFQPASTGNPQFLSDSGVLVWGGSGNTNNEDLQFDFETTENTIAISSSTGVTNLTWAGSITMGGSTSGTLVTRVKAGAPDEVDANGSLVVDSTNYRLYFRYGDAWHYVAQTAGFQIPNFELEDVITREQILEKDFVLGQINETLEDGALHGVWVKYSSLIKQITGQLLPLNEDGSVGDGKIEGIDMENYFVVGIKNILAAFGINVGDKAGQIKTVRIERMEMVDSSTGDIYCTWIENGEWKKIKGACKDVDVELPAEEPPVEDAGTGGGSGGTGGGEQSPAEEPTVVSGCTDLSATNYNSSATQDDGSCQYPPAEEPPASADDGSGEAEPAEQPPAEQPPAEEEPPASADDGSGEAEPAEQPPAEQPPPTE